MRGVHPVERLAGLSRSFGPKAAGKKRRLLERIGSLPKLTRKQLLELQDTLVFIRAYPDDPAVLRAAEGVSEKMRVWVRRFSDGDELDERLLNSGLPGSSNSYAYSYAVLQRLTRLFPGNLELDWDAIEDESDLIDLLGLLVARAEVQGLEDIGISLRDWLEQACAPSDRTALELLLSLVEGSSLNPQQQMHLYEGCDPLIVYRLNAPGTGRSEAIARRERVHYQKRDVPREKFPLAPAIRRPLRSYRRVSRRRGQELIDLSLLALCSRNLEIYPLIYANPDDVTVVDCGRGFDIVLAGVLPSHRNALESLLFFLILKNGVPVAYGPASIFLGCCEMGINLFPEFRGGEIRFIYAQFMRSLYHLADVRYFFLTAYGMGENNDDALRSGAFWFYRKLGFRASNPDVERLAVAEEARMRRRSGYRCDMKTLRRLSHTSAHLDLSGGKCRPLEFGALGLALSTEIAGRYGGDRRRATDASVRKLRRDLPMTDYRTWTNTEREALESLGPLLNLIDDLDSWTRSDLRALVSVIRAKGGRSEYGFMKRAARHSRLGEALHSIANRA